MGTLFNQQPRQFRDINFNEIDSFLNDIAELAKKHKMEKKDIIDAYKTLELKRQNNLYVENGDIYDEQMSGIGKILQEISSNLARMVELSENNIE